MRRTCVFPYESINCVYNLQNPACMDANACARVCVCVPLYVCPVNIKRMVHNCREISSLICSFFALMIHYNQIVIIMVESLELPQASSVF